MRAASHDCGCTTRESESAVYVAPAMISWSANCTDIEVTKVYLAKSEPTVPTTPSEARYTGVPKGSMDEPGASVSPAMTKWDAVSAV